MRACPEPRIACLGQIDQAMAAVITVTVGIGARRQQFGQPGLRVFRLLVTLRQLEQKQVSEKAMLPMKDTRELLYRMLKAGTISLQVHCLIPFAGW